MSFRILLLACLATACTPITDAPNPFAGCYDRSCVDTPQLVSGLPSLQSISSRNSHTCGLTATGEAWCWGDNVVGELGDGSTDVRSTPVKVAGNITFTSVSVGAQFSCGLAADGTVYCWGNAAGGALGRVPVDSAPTNDKFACGTSRGACSRTPVAVIGGMKAVAAGMRHVCALTTAGKPVCWGLNAGGEVGTPTLDVIYLTPQQVVGVRQYSSIYASDSFTCALATDSHAWCWGTDERGQLGDIAPTCGTLLFLQKSCTPTPMSVRDGDAYTMLSLGQTGACATSSAGVAKCWGDGNGALGSSTNPARAQVIQPSTSFSVIHEASGATCGTPIGKPSVCWGVNTFGQLGIGQRLEIVNDPMTIAGNRSFIAFASGTNHICALTAAGATYCWGSGLVGQLGTGPLKP